MGHDVHAGPLRGPKIKFLGQAAEGAKSCGGGGFRARGDLSPAKSCGGGGNQGRGDLLDAESCGGGSSQARGDLRITTGSELWSSAGPRKSGRRRCSVKCLYDRLIWYCFVKRVSERGIRVVQCDDTRFDCDVVWHAHG